MQKEELGNLSYTIKIDVPKHITGITIKNCMFNTIAPQQFCFLCKELYDPYLVNDEVWNKLSVPFRDKYICSKCLRTK